MKICNIYSLRDIDDLRLKVKNEICKTSKSYLYQLMNKYSNDYECEANFKHKIEKLQTYNKIFVRLKDQSLGGFASSLDRES